MWAWRLSSSDVEDEVTLTLLSRLPVMIQDFEVEMHDRVSSLETAVEYAVDHGLRPECAKMLRNIVFQTHHDVFRQASHPTVALQPRVPELLT